MAASSPSPNSPPLATPPPLPAPPPISSPPPPSVASPPDSSSPPAPATSPPPSVTSPPPVPATSPSPVSSPPPVPGSATPPTNAPPPPPPVSAPPPQTPSPPPSTPLPPTIETPPPSSNDPPPPPTTTANPPSDSPPAPPSNSPSPPTQISPPVSHLSPPGNPLLAPPPPRNSTATFASDSTSSGLPVAAVVAIGLGAGLLLLALIIWCIAKRNRRGFQYKTEYLHAYPHGSTPHPDSNLIIKTEASSPFVRSGSSSGALNASSTNGGLGHSRSGFTYQELYEATNGFALDNLLGEGGFGPVYKGVFANGKEVAVKQLKNDGNQGEREFMAEVEIISRIHHRHLVSLVGYCIYDSQRLLVYEYMPNQTLHYHLHEQKSPTLDWATRIKIAVGAARGIAYLHEDCNPRIIHRDIKSSNILLDANFEAQVSDFGLAKLAVDLDTHISTRVMGTFGYMAPEYVASGKLTEKSDVYSYGVVLLELITGRRPVDENQPIGNGSLVEWARPLLNYALDTGQVDGLVDLRLENNYIESEMLIMIEAAAACVRHLAAKRPRMGQVVRAFDALSPADLSNGMRVGESTMHDGSQANSDIRFMFHMTLRNKAWSTDHFSHANRKYEHTNSNSNPTQNAFLSSHKTQNRTYSGQSTISPDSSGPSSQNVDSSSRESPIH